MDAALQALMAEPVWPDSALLEQIRRESGRARLVVFDDDPTGMQTMYGVPVLLDWEPARLREVLRHDWPAVYVLTNSRSLPEAEARRVTAEAAAAVLAAAAELGLAVRVVSRSDSTLRGHFPAESDALAEQLALRGRTVRGTLLVPAFFEGGRVTLGGTHYVRDGERLVPAHETEFARDASFGYRSAYLPEYVAEKTGGRVPAEQVAVLDLAAIRRGGPEAVARWLLGLPPGAVAAVDALAYRDLEVVALGLLRAERMGASFLCRTAASFVRAYSGLAERPLLAPSAIVERSAAGGGLCVVGSYVRKSGEQLARLLALPGLAAVELSVQKVLHVGSSDRDAEVHRAVAAVTAALEAGQDAVLYTSRELVKGGSPAESLAIGQAVSGALTATVEGLGTRPRFLVAKGGITSHDLAAKALKASVALVLGQALPGVPVWELGAGSRFPGMPYVVFPGNVGGPDDLAGLVRAMRTQ